jgi:hypothetical protein
MALYYGLTRMANGRSQLIETCATLHVSRLMKDWPRVQPMHPAQTSPFPAKTVRLTEDQGRGYFELGSLNFELLPPAQQPLQAVAALSHTI